MCRIITPTLAARLRAGPVDDGSFAEGHLARRIACVPAGVKHTWKHGWIRAIRSAEAQGNIAK